MATAKIAKSDFNADSLNMVVANEVDADGNYIYNEDMSDDGNYKVVASNYAAFEVISNTVATVTEEAAAAIEEEIQVSAAEEGAKITVNPVDETARVSVRTAVKTEERLKKSEKIVTYDLKLVKGDKTIQPESGKTVAVTIPVPEELSGAKFISVYRLVDKVLTFLGSVKAGEDDKFTFRTDHFSTYIFAAAEKEEASSLKIADNSGDEKESGSSEDNKTSSSTPTEATTTVASSTPKEEATSGDVLCSR